MCFFFPLSNGKGKKIKRKQATMSPTTPISLQEVNLIPFKVQIILFIAPKKGLVMFSGVLTSQGNPRRLYFSKSLITLHNSLNYVVNRGDEPNNPNLSLVSYLWKPERFIVFFRSLKRLMCRGIFFWKPMMVIIACVYI